jgi:hypothetical protein
MNLKKSFFGGYNKASVDALIEELNKLNETIEEQKANLRKADEALSEAEAKKEQCLVLLYGTATEKEG